MKFPKRMIFGLPVERPVTACLLSGDSGGSQSPPRVLPYARDASAFDEGFGEESEILVVDPLSHV